MTKNIKILFSLVTAVILGIPFNWIQYKGQETVSIFQIFDLGIQNLFIDISLLAVDTLIVFFIWSAVLNLINRGKLVS